MSGTFYSELLATARSLTEGESHTGANLANLAALLGQSLADINWAGFYLMDGGMLVLGPFWGKPACIRIPLERGVCGAAARTGKVQRVADVHAFPGHIACDGASRSEIVLPIRQNGRVVAVLDIDSPSLSRFTPQDEAGLLQLTGLLESLDWGRTGYTLC